MGQIIRPEDFSFHQSESTEEKLINSYFCGQIYALHTLIYYLFKSKRKFNYEDITNFIDARYCYLIREYPNFYNTLVKNDKQLGAEAENDYFKLFNAMLTYHKNVGKRKPKSG